MAAHQAQLFLEWSVRRFLSRYLVSAGVAVNLLLALLVVAWLWHKFVSSDVYEQTRRQFLGPLDGVSVTPARSIHS
jgi:flagellar biogenesis protein FliO